MSDIFENFNWHSSIGIDEELGNKRFYTKLPNTKKARSMFKTAGSNLLIHKTTRSLWKLSDDTKSIIPVFDADILTEDDVRHAMKEEE